MALNLVNFAGMLKTLYSKRKIENISMNDHPLLQMIKKDESASGELTKQPLIYQNMAGSSNTFSNVVTNSANANTKVAGFLLNMVDTFNMALISDKTIKASRNDAGAFMQAVKTQVDGMLQGTRQMLATNLYRSGYGNIGQVSSPGASTTLTLTDPADALNFTVDQVLVFASTVNSSTLRNSGASLTVDGVNYRNGTLTMSANVNTISGISDGDYIFVAGTRQDSATPTRLQMAGLEAWAPVTAPVAGDPLFFGVDRSTNSLLYGQSLDATNLPIVEALNDAIYQIQAIRGYLTHFFLNPIKFQQLINSLGAKVQYVNPNGNANVGFKGVEILTGKKPVMVISDSDCPSNRMWGVNLDCLVLWSMGPVASLYDGDGNIELRTANDNSVEVRTYTYSQLGTSAPAWMINVQL